MSSSRAQLLKAANECQTISFEQVPNSFRHRSQYYQICAANVKAEFLSALYEARGGQLRFRVCSPVNRLVHDGQSYIEVEPVGLAKKQSKKMSATSTSVLVLQQAPHDQVLDLVKASVPTSRSTALVLPGSSSSTGGPSSGTATKAGAASSCSRADDTLNQLLELRDNVARKVIPGLDQNRNYNCTKSSYSSHNSNTVPLVVPGAKNSFILITGVQETTQLKYPEPKNDEQRAENAKRRVFLRGMGLDCSGGPKSAGGGTFDVLAFVGDYIARFDCATTREKDVESRTPLEDALLQPGKQPKSTLVASKKNKASKNNKNKDAKNEAKKLDHELVEVPINPSQQEAVDSLTKRINVVEGPPGTGKSTTIYHILKAYIMADPSTTAQEAVDKRNGKGQGKNKKGKNGNAKKQQKNQQSHQLSASGGTESENPLVPHQAKSTFIRAQKAALVTCVTNQAVNAVMEKLGPLDAHGVKSLVLGNPSKIGAAAQGFTLQAKALRDPWCAFITEASTVMSAMRNAVESAQRSRINRLLGGEAVKWSTPEGQNPCKSNVGGKGRGKRNRNDRKNTKGKKNKMDSECGDVYYPSPSQGITKSRLTFSQLRQLFQKNFTSDYDALVANRDKRLKERLDYCKKDKAKQDAARKESESEFQEAMECAHLAVVNRVRHAMAAAFVEAKKYRKTQRLLSILRNCVNRVSHFSYYLRSSAMRRTVRESNVFLFTISSGHQILRLQRDYELDFPPRLLLGILDEAGATAETYIPLILETDIENLVLLGDQRQLRPLVIAPDSENVDEKQVTRSLLERCVACKSGSTMLREQYRMPRKLCTLVSRLFYNSKLITPASKVELVPKRLQLRWIDCGYAHEMQLGTSYIAPAQVVATLCLLLGHARAGDVEMKINSNSSPAQKQDSGRGGKTRRQRKAEGAQKKDACSTDQANQEQKAEQEDVDESTTSLDQIANPSAEVMVICMYLPQMRLLRAALPSSVLQRGNFRLVTVDAAQGTEADHVVLVAGRCNPHRRVGFTKVKNRLNVAISRAKQSLTVVGCSATMQSDPSWRQVAQTCTVFGFEDPSSMAQRATNSNFSIKSNKASSSSKNKSSTRPDNTSASKTSINSTAGIQEVAAQVEKVVGTQFSNAREIDFDDQPRFRRAKKHQEKQSDRAKGKGKSKGKAGEVSFSSKKGNKGKGKRGKNRNNDSKAAAGETSGAGTNKKGKGKSKNGKGKAARSTVNKKAC
ncbi:unnamed protein product [Amoebophrya sp. A25]|nr:unnamed protein product [Amoebophrya sp. A25]|eukprot:GSA25T00027014001.1